MLKDIHQIQIKGVGESHVNVAEAACVLSLLFVCLHDNLAANKLLQDAKRIMADQGATPSFDAMLNTAQKGLQLVTVGH